MGMCTLEAEISEEEYQEMGRKHQVFIVDGCSSGPEKTDVFVEQRNGYKVYTDTSYAT
jgi:hypothetical protein